MADYGEGTGILAIAKGQDRFSAQKNLDNQKRRKPMPDENMKMLKMALQKRKMERGGMNKMEPKSGR
jgi:hypothetical protein